MPVDDALLLLEKEGTRSTAYDAARAVGGGGDCMKILDPPPLPPMPAVDYGGDNDGGAGTAKDECVRNSEGSSPAPIRSIHAGPSVPAV